MGAGEIGYTFWLMAFIPHSQYFVKPYPFLLQMRNDVMLSGMRAFRKMSSGLWCYGAAIWYTEASNLELVFEGHLKHC